jgi:hypothetical protein
VKAVDGVVSVYNQIEWSVDDVHAAVPSAG